MSQSNLSIQPIEESPIAVPEFSSQYGSQQNHVYAVENICSEAPEIYPLYGDSTHALVFRTYGPWWMTLPSYKETKRNFRRWENDFTSRDYIDVRYPTRVSNCTTLNLYETYNPGTLEVVYAGEEKEDGSITWHRVWKFPQPFSIVLQNDQEIYIENGRQRMNDVFPDHVNTTISALNSLKLNTGQQQMSKIHTRHTCPPAARFSRIVRIPLEGRIPFPTRHIRLEFDHCTAGYYIEIDTITLSSLPQPVSQVHAPPTQEPMVKKEPSIDLLKLPFDLLLLICSYLDLRSLTYLSATCRYFREQCLHPLQFQSLDLQPYWSTITSHSLEQFFSDRCVQTRNLSLAWTKSIRYSSFTQLLEVCSTNLVQLNLACCQYLTGDYIQSIVNLCPNIEIFNLENCISLTDGDFIPLKDLAHIRSFNVYRTAIDYRTLLPLIENNKQHLEHINLGSCQNLGDTIGIVQLIFARCTNLRSIDLWRVNSLTPNGYLSIVGALHDNERFDDLSDDGREELAKIYSLVNLPVQIESLAHMTCLSEIDIGWTDPPPGFIQSLVQQAGQALIKIFLTACRRVDNDDIMAVSEHCLQLRQLDLLGSSVINEAAIECVLKRCLFVEFLDLSFCSKISDATIDIWIREYRDCFKRSYSPLNNDEFPHEFA